MPDTNNPTNIRLDDLINVEVTEPAEGDMLLYTNGKWRNTKERTDTVYFEDWTEGEPLEVISTTPPFEVTSLRAIDIKDTSITLTWIASKSSDVKHYNIYNDTVLLGSVTDTTFTVTGLSQNSNYNFYVKTVNMSNIESSGMLLSVETLPSRYYLYMDGITSSLIFPAVNHDNIILTVRFLSTYIQPKGSSGLFYSADYNMNYLVMSGAKGSQTLGLFTEDTLIAPSAIPKNSLQIITLKLKAPISKKTGIFTKYDTTPQVRGDLFNITFRLGEIIVAQYDLSTGTVVDQSGNGLHANLKNGEWVTIPY